MLDLKSTSYCASKTSETDIRFSDNDDIIFVRGSLVDRVNKVSNHVRQSITVPKTGSHVVKHTWENLASECAAYPTIEMREKVFAATLTAFSTDGHLDKSVIFNHQELIIALMKGNRFPKMWNRYRLRSLEGGKLCILCTKAVKCTLNTLIRLSLLTLARNMTKHSMRS